MMVVAICRPMQTWVKTRSESNVNEPKKNVRCMLRVEDTKMYMMTIKVNIDQFKESIY